MFNLSKFDFSKEASFKDSLKDSLLQKCKERYAVGLNKAVLISDDELEFVAAAGTTSRDPKCPNPSLPCEQCSKYLHDPSSASCCIDGCVK